jgi:hypothetical protein
MSKQYTTVHDRYQISDSCCGMVETATSLKKASARARAHAERHAVDADNSTKVVTVFDVMARRDCQDTWEFPIKAADLALASAGFKCSGCGRPELECSAAPCKGVKADREEGLPPDPEGTNDKSAEQAQDTLYHFEEKHGEAPYGGISAEQLTDLHRQNIVDLLANLGHYCDRNGLDMQEIIASAVRHYDAETGNQGTQFTVSN